MEKSLNPSGKCRNLLETVVVSQGKNLRIFPDDPRSISDDKHLKLTGIQKKNSEDFPVGIRILELDKTHGFDRFA